MRSHEDWLADVRSALAGLNIEVVVIGAVAALQYRSTPRATADVDLLTSALDQTSEALAAAGFDVDASRGEDSRAFLLSAVRGDVHVHVLLAETEYQREALARAKDGYLTAEDVLIHKLIAWRLRDQDDVRSILEAGTEIDSSYVERWVKAWGVEDRWRDSGGWRERGASD